jgi:hypothetical protein
VAVFVGVNDDLTGGVAAAAILGADFSRSFTFRTFFGFIVDNLVFHFGSFLGVFSYSIDA